MPLVIEQNSLPDLTDNNEHFLNVLLNISAPASAATARRLRPKLYVDDVDTPIRSATWDESGSTATLSVELVTRAHQAAITRTSSIKFEAEEYLAGVWTLKKTYCDGAVLATSAYNLENSGSNPNDSFSITVKPLLQQKLELTPDQIVVLHDPVKVSVSDTDLETIPNIDGTTGTATVTPVASMTLQSVLEYIADLYGCVGVKTNINATAWPLTRVDFPAAQPYWNTVAGIIGNHEPGVQIDADNYLVIRDGTLTDYLAARTMTLANFSNLKLNNTIERFKGCVLSRQLSSASWDYSELRQEIKQEWFGGTNGTYPMTQITEWYLDFYKTGIAIPVWSQLAVHQQLEYEDLPLSPPFLVSASAEQYSFTYDQNGARPIRTNSREWGYMNVPTSFVTFNTTNLPSPNADALAVFLGEPDAYSATNVTDHTEALVLTKDETTYYSYRPMIDGVEVSYVSQTDTETYGLITKDTENQQLGTDFQQPWGKAQESGNLAEGQDAYWGITDTRKESQKAEKKRNVTLRTKRHSRLNSSQSLVAENYTDRRKGDVGDSDTQVETKPVYITTNGDPTASLWRSVNGGEAPIEILQPLCNRLNKSQDFPGGINGELPTYDETVNIGLVFDPKVDGRTSTSLGIFEVEAYQDVFKSVSEGGFKTTITQARQIG